MLPVRDLAELSNAGIGKWIDTLRGDLSFNRLSERGIGDLSLSATLQRWVAGPINRVPEIPNLIRGAECLNRVQPLRVTPGDLYLAAGISMEMLGLVGLRRTDPDHLAAGLLGPRILGLDVPRLGMLAQIGQHLADAQDSAATIAALASERDELRAQLAMNAKRASRPARRT